MAKKFKIALIVLVLIGVSALITLFFVTHPVAVLDPKGMIAIKQRRLIITACLLMLIVVIPVLLMTWIFAWKYRASNKNAKYTPEWSHSYIAEVFWWGIPLVIVVFLAIITWTSSHALDPFKPIDRDKKPLKVQVVALQWKWLFIYPEQGVASINFMQLPEKTPIYFEITADAPMNSFWIPQLGGQMYAMPAMRSKLHLIADEKGTYKGLSSNISGTGFAGMTFVAKVTTEEDFNSWVSSVKQASSPLNFELYRDIAKPSSYNPVATYVLNQNDLFDQIVMKYHKPPKD